MSRYRLTPVRKITVLGAPPGSARETLAVIDEAISDELGRVRAERVGGRLVAEVATILPSIVIQRRLADAGIQVEVESVLRPV